MSPDQWDRFCRVLGDEGLRTDPRFAMNADRLQHHAEFRSRVESILETAPTADWVVRFEAAAIASGPIYEFDEVFEDPQVRHLGVVTEMDQPGYGPVRMLSFPFKASATPAAIRRPAPLLGEHTAEVLEEFGRDAADIERLAAGGVIALGPAAARPK
jgi:crotonobetainyl-CoA:carnitine CoA-transferase CaiB-like acyl-CoA transferase